MWCSCLGWRRSGYASTDQAGRRLVEVQLVTTRIASVAEWRPRSGEHGDVVALGEGLHLRWGPRVGD